MRAHPPPGTRRPSARGRGSRRPTVGGLLAVLGLSLVLAGCGLPGGSGPTALPKNQVPDHLLSPNAPVGPATGASTVPVQIWLLSPAATPAQLSRLVPKPGSQPAAQIRSALVQLMDGPDAAEVALGITTAIPAPSRVLSTSVSSGPTGTIVTVNLNDTFGQAGAAQVVAVHQVWLTVTGNYPITTGVLFEIQGQPIDVPVPHVDGALVPGPVTADDYLPPAPTAAGTSSTT